MHWRSPTVLGAAAAAAAAIALAACSQDSPTVPAMTSSPEVRYSLEDGQTVLNAQLQPVGTSTSEAFGQIQLKFLPPSPISPPSPIAMTITGRIFNPELESLSGVGGIFELPSIFSDGGLVSSFDVAIPGGPPIRTFQFETTTLISSDLATLLTNSRGSYSISVGNLEGRFAPSGPPIVPSGPPI